MRVTFSLLVSSVVLGSLVFNGSDSLNRSYMLIGDTGGKMLLSAKPKPKPKSNEPENPAPHRGSGRRDLIESLNNAFPVG
ncbi:hypothetical protein H6G80_34550 [Nostoc sp. FACHB-87]|uniref:heterocyst-inhibiting protein PatX n=1 Tax=Nostocales TaxID=1161 RepID=UPI001683899B|nr:MULTISPECIES: hypothetical protein [Nostocales]MBD2302644.1 hypothetical protein [Nostoc sp. FACHB-190]MBD2459157.1 hypothetical protein [Nostoc sp. FACHB-87]MBD2478990.1 hypothetical protein [Anabaena sp. FACHB-83]MBD2491877.1 hypothetical protein [Aulosira sp. FACHB-615]